MWIVIAGFCAIVAVALLLVGKPNGAFVSGALGVLAWFLDMRSRFSRSLPKLENVPQPENDGPGDQNQV